MNHNHHHHHSASHTTSGIQIAFFLNFAFSLIEFYGGLRTNSVSILSDALHDFGDSLALGLAWALESYSHKLKDAKYSYGYRRFSLLSAVINLFILTAGSSFLLIESAKRLLDPPTVQGFEMMGFAVLGLLVNGIGAWVVSKNHSHNHQTVFWHLLEDVLGWAAVLIAGFIIHFTHYGVIDPILSVLLNLFILYNVSRRLRETVRIFLQAVPKSVNMDDIEKEIRSLENIVNVHALQAWSLDGDHHFLNCHVIVKDSITRPQMIELKSKIKKQLEEKHFTETAIEFEFESESCGTTP